MDDGSGSRRLTARDVRLDTPAGPFPAGSRLDLVLDDEAMWLSSVAPAATAQLPLASLLSPRVSLLSDTIAVSAWLSGASLHLAIPISSLRGGDARDLATLLGAEPPRRRQHSRALLLVGAVALAIALVGAAALGIAALSRSSPNPSRAELRSLTAAMNLRESDLPRSWGIDSPASSPLAGLLGSGPAGTVTAAERRANARAVTSFQTCMGLRKASDRTFGSAGVSPQLQIPSLPYGLAGSSSLVEAGTVTQRYGRSADVAADVAQARSRPFGRCFAEIIGRLTLIGVDPSQATARLPIRVQDLRAPLGTTVIGGSVELPFPVGTTTLPVEIGITWISARNYEQILYTFASSTSFPAAERARLVSILGARLAGHTASRSA